MRHVVTKVHLHGAGAGLEVTGALPQQLASTYIERETERETDTHK